MLDANPGAIVEAHLSYLRAGSKCITTASYQASVRGFMDLGYAKEEAHRLISRSVELAEEAIVRFRTGGSNEDLFIAASIGPYGAYLADGSEYRGKYGVTDEQLENFHRDRIEILDETGAHFFACETMPDFQEVKVLVSILETTKKKAWISFSCKDEKHLNDGTPIAECAAYLSDHANIFALGVNCTAPQHISGLITELKANARHKKIVIYPNSGEVYHADTKTWLGLSDPDAFAKMTQEWLSLGVDIIGGCCRIGPEHIGKMGDYLHLD